MDGVIWKIGRGEKMTRLNFNDFKDTWNVEILPNPTDCRPCIFRITTSFDSEPGGKQMIISRDFSTDMTIEMMVTAMSFMIREAKKEIERNHKKEKDNE